MDKRYQSPVSSDKRTSPSLKPPPLFFEGEPYEEPSYREHVSGSLVPDPAEASRFRQAYQAQPPYYQQPWLAAQPQPYQQPSAYPPGGAYYQPYNPYGSQHYAASNGYAYYPYYGYYGYPPTPYYLPRKPKRDGYLLGINIAALVCSGLVALGGILGALLLLMFTLAPAGGNVLPDKQLFTGVVMIMAFTVACLLGGGFGIYHSLRSLFHKRSMAFKLPWFWIFLAFYILVAAIGGAIGAHNASISNIPFTIFLIALAGLLPALTILALGVRRVSYPRENRWATTWRRFTLSLVSGATSAIVFASIFELIITLVLGSSLGISSFSLDNPNQPVPNDPRTLIFMFLILSVMAPIVEEGVKPLAAILLIRRVGSAAEAFVLGLACGIGFDLIETTGYISQGYQGWLNVALERSTAGLLHGFGAAMMTLGWYIITHPEVVQKRRFLLGFGCMFYALLQHAVWNGTFVLQLLPAPIGPFFDHGSVQLASITLSADVLPYIVLSALMIAFFIFMTNRVKALNPRSGPPLVKPRSSPQTTPVPTHQTSPRMLYKSV